MLLDWPRPDILAFFEPGATYVGADVAHWHDPDAPEFLDVGT